jgi:hypothetical protein
MRTPSTAASKWLAADIKTRSKEDLSSVAQFAKRNRSKKGARHQTTIHLHYRVALSGNTFAPALDHIRSGSSSVARRGC